MKIVKLSENILIRHRPETKLSEGEHITGFGVRDENAIYGWITAIVDKTSNTAEIDAFYIEEEYRGMGYGKELLMSLIDALRSQGIEAVMASLSIPEDARGAAFLISHGFYDSVPEYTVYHVNHNMLCAYVDFEEKRFESNHNKGTSDSLGAQISFEALEDLSDQQVLDVINGPAKAFISFMESGIDRHLSMAAFRGGKAVAVILVRRWSEMSFVPDQDQISKAAPKGSTIEIPWLGSLGNSSLDIVRLIRKFMKRLTEELPLGTVIDIAATRNSTSGLIEKLFEEEKWKKGINVSHVMKYVRIIKVDDVLQFYMEE